MPNEYWDQSSARLKLFIPKEPDYLTLLFSRCFLAYLGECCQKPRVALMRYDCALDFRLPSFCARMIPIQYHPQDETCDVVHEIEADYPELPGLVYLT